MKNSQCRKIAEELWSYWPKDGDVPHPLIEHSDGCVDCQAELKSFRALCRRSTTAQGQALSWSALLPEFFWTRWSAALRQAARPASAAVARPWVWAPAALVFVAVLAVWNRIPRRAASPEAPVPVEAVENMELLEHLDMLQNMDMLEAASTAEPTHE